MKIKDIVAFVPKSITPKAGKIYRLSVRAQKKDSLIVEITHTQSQLAEYLNVSRPALSKEINKIIKEGLITMEGKRVEILNKAALEKFI